MSKGLWTEHIDGGVAGNQIDLSGQECIGATMVPDRPLSFCDKIDPGIRIAGILIVPFGSHREQFGIEDGDVQVVNYLFESDHSGHFIKNL